MSHILHRAAAFSRQQTCDSPLDLSFNNKYTSHIPDPLVNEEDLRHDVDSASPDDVRLDSGFGTSDTGLDVTTSESSSEASSDDSVVVKQEVKPVRSRNHLPFSIDAILGNTEDNSSADEHSAPAIVSSTFATQAYQSQLLYHNYIIGLRQHVQEPSTECSSGSGNSVQQSYWCHVCNALCIDSEDAKKHQYFHRLQGARCNLRKSMFYMQGYVSRHLKLDEEKMQCGLCDKTVAHCFFTKHQRLHDGHICEVCNKEFSTNSRLQDHMNIHSGVSPFKCTICDRRFSKRSSLTQHYRYHRDHKSFKCSFCNKCFNSKYARAVHERLHTGDNPFKCTVPGCPRAFPQKIQLKLHLTSHRM